MIAVLLLVTATPVPPDDCSAAVEIMRDVVLPDLPEARALRSRLDFSQNAIPPGVKLLPDGTMIRPNGDDERSRWESTSHKNMVAECPEVRALLKQERIRLYSPAARPAWSIHNKRTWRDVTYRVSMPQVSADGTEAMFERSMFCSGRCGQAEIVKVRRTASGGWAVVDRLLLWVS